MLSRLFSQKSQEEATLNQLTQNHLLAQIHFAILSHDKRNKPVHYFFKHETVLPSQKRRLTSNSVHFGNIQFSTRKKDGGGKIIFKRLDLFSFEAVRLFQNQNKKPIKKNTKTLLQQSAFLNLSDITDNDDPFEKKHRMVILPTCFITDQYSIYL